MSLDLPKNATEVASRAKTDVQRELPTSNPFLRNSWLGALIVSFSNRVFDFYLQLTESNRQALPDTSTGAVLKRWAAIWGITNLAATASTGSVVATGVDATVVPIATVYKSSDALTYTSTAAATVTLTSLSVSSITRVGVTATVTTLLDHALANNVAVTISGAVETDYNVTDVDIIVTALNKFTYAVANSPTTPATGVILAGHTSIPVPVLSDAFGVALNQTTGTVLTLQTPIVDVDNDAGVDFSALTGGADQETDDAVKLRMLDRIRNPIAHFNVAEIVAKAKTILGVTRVFVQEVTPAVGQVTIYFMRDNDVNPIPDAGEVTTVKNALLTIKPANTADADVIVSAPTAVPTAFTFTLLSPDTVTMRAAIQASLEQFFDEQTTVGADVDQDAYRSAIFNTVDTVTGDTLASFTLSAPAGDIVIAAGEIGTLGIVTYP